ncbi:hypothetical protein BH23ACT2_BH23ACT2_22340 [soil metagenome]
MGADREQRIRPRLPGSFDRVFVCFVLEHLADPVEALTAPGTLLRPGGMITVIEGDHGSAFLYPDSTEARDAIRCQVELQRQAGGNALIGRQVYPLLVEADFADVQVSPRVVYVDASRPNLVEGSTRNTFTAMVEGVRAAAARSSSTAPDRSPACASRWPARRGGDGGPEVVLQDFEQSQTGGGASAMATATG